MAAIECGATHARPLPHCKTVQWFPFLKDVKQGELAGRPQSLNRIFHSGGPLRSPDAVFTMIQRAARNAHTLGTVPVGEPPLQLRGFELPDTPGLVQAICRSEIECCYQETSVEEASFAPDQPGFKDALVDRSRVRLAGVMVSPDPVLPSCSFTLVSQRLLITALHCLTGVLPSDKGMAPSFTDFNRRAAHSYMADAVWAIWTPTEAFAAMREVRASAAPMRLNDGFTAIRPTALVFPRLVKDVHSTYPDLALVEFELPTGTSIDPTQLATLSGRPFQKVMQEPIFSLVSYGKADERARVCEPKNYGPDEVCQPCARLTVGECWEPRAPFGPQIGWTLSPAFESLEDNGRTVSLKVRSLASAAIGTTVPCKGDSGAGLIAAAVTGLPRVPYPKELLGVVSARVRSGHAEKPCLGSTTVVTLVDPFRELICRQIGGDDAQSAVARWQALGLAPFCQSVAP